jgi:hypothetical protein
LRETSDRIAHVTEELRIIQRQLDEATRKVAARQEMVDSLVAGDLLNDLKLAVDNMRQFLWSYIEATAQGPEEMKSAIQGYRMQRVTEMLRVLRESDDEELHKTKYAHSFFEEINSIAHEAVDRYQEAEAAAAAHKRPKKK